MKRRFKAVMTVLCAAVLAFNLMPAKANAAVAENTAYFAFADESWGNQYWGEGSDGNTAGVVATDAKITGPGQYTVSVDFTGTESGKATGLAFTAIMIENGEVNFPGHLIQLDSIVVNGEEISFTKNYTSCDADGKNQLRTNLFNQWAGDITDPKNNPRTADGSLTDASATIVDPAAFAEVETLSCTFTLLSADGGAEEAPAAETTDKTDVPKTGVVGLGLLYGLGAIATGAVVLKRKEK